MVEHRWSERDHLDQRIWALLSGSLRDPEDIKEVARLLTAEFIPRVMGVLKKLGVDKITAEDIAKEAVEKAVRTYVPGRAKFLTFVTRIALNIRADRYRRGLLPPTDVQPFRDDVPVLEEIFDDSPGTEDPGAESEFVKRVRTIFPLLSQEDRILIQFDIQGVPKESYMDVYGISATAYRQRKSRAYARLRDFYKRQYR